MDQALRAGRIATKDEAKIKELLNSVGCMIKDIPMENTPPETGDIIYREVSRITGISDPYKEIKKANIKEVLALYPELKKIEKASGNSLLTAIRIAIAGNVIDFGANENFNIEEELYDIFKRDFAILDYDEFRNSLNETHEILYIGDNAGECVFDKILIEEMKKPVIYIVRDMPVINDAIYEDAVQAGIDKVATILSSGTDAPGTILSTCTPEFKQIYNRSTFIISKGQGNYEALSSEKRPIFFLLKTKCHVIANHIGSNEGDFVLKAVNTYSGRAG